MRSVDNPEQHARMPAAASTKVHKQPTSDNTDSLERG